MGAATRRGHELPRDMQIEVVRRLDMDGRRALGLVSRLRVPNGLRDLIWLTMARRVEPGDMMNNAGTQFLNVWIPHEGVKGCYERVLAMLESEARAYRGPLKALVLTTLRALKAQGGPGARGIVYTGSLSRGDQLPVRMSLYAPGAPLEASLFLLMDRPMFV